MEYNFQSSNSKRRRAKKEKEEMFKFMKEKIKEKPFTNHLVKSIQHKIIKK